MGNGGQGKTSFATNFSLLLVRRPLTAQGSDGDSETLERFLNMLTELCEDGANRGKLLDEFEGTLEDPSPIRRLVQDLRQIPTLGLPSL